MTYMVLIKKEEIDSILDSYKGFKIATICSHSSLQIFKAARQEGIKTIGIVIRDKKELYESFPLGRPDEFLVVDSYQDISDSDLVAKNAIVIPHGSFVEYLGEKVDSMKVPLYGNRSSLIWERNRNKMFDWMHKAKVKTPKILQPDEISGPALVKFPGAKGGRGYVIVNSRSEFRLRVGEKDCMIQEFIIGVRAYPHYFFSPFSKNGFKTNHGSLELMGVDKRVESSADEIARAVSAGMHPKMGFTVIGNEPMVLRESLLQEYMEMAKRISDSSFDLFGGMFGPFCIETIISEDLEIYAFEVSARIVAGTNMYMDGSPYSSLYYNEPMSMGKRIVRELKYASKNKKLKEIIY